MPEVQGTVQSVRIEEEGNDVVLRFVIHSTDQRIPVEMRGRQVSGVLEDGDQVRVMTGKVIRDKDGVCRPDRVENISTASYVSVPRQKRARGCLGFTGSLAASVLSGVITTLLVAVLLPGYELAGGAAGRDDEVDMMPGGEEEPPPPMEEEPFDPDMPPEMGGGGSFNVMPVVFGLVVAVGIFVVTYMIPRKDRGSG